MLPIYHLFTLIFYVIFEITIVSVNSFNSCVLEKGCQQNTVECNNTTHLCYCRTNDRQPDLTYYQMSEIGVCLQTANVNSRCIQYKPCLNAKCLLTNGLEVNFNDRIKRNAFWKSLDESIVKTNQNKQLLGVCRCDKSRHQRNCNYRVIGSICSDQRHCSQAVAHSQCTNGVCACNQSHYHLDDNCLQKKNFDQFCTESGECMSNLFCRGSQCRCKKSYEFDVKFSICVLKSGDSNEITTNNNSLWDDIAKVGGFVIIVVLMLFLCTKKDSELQNQNSITGSHRRRSSSRAHRQRSSSINSHRPLTQTSSNASRSSAYRTFEESVPIRQTIIVPSPAQLIRSLSSSSDSVEYNPYQFDTLFPQQSDIDDPPSYEEVVKDMDKH